MPKHVAVMTDSNSGLTIEQGRELGVKVLPMPVIIGEDVYYEDVNLNHEEFYRHLAAGDNVFTSQPSPDLLIAMWKELLDEYDEVVYIPMSSGLSGSCQTAKMLALDFDGRVEVADNHRISVTMRNSVIEAALLANAGKDAATIRAFLEKSGPESGIYIMVDTLTYLRRGGRITPAAAMLGNMLRLKPVLSIRGEKLDAFAKARNVSSACQIMLQAIASDVERLFGANADPSSYRIDMAYTFDREAAEQFKTQVQEAFPMHKDDIYLDRLPLSIAAHIGPGALAVTCTALHRFS